MRWLFVRNSCTCGTGTADFRLVRKAVRGMDAELRSPHGWVYGVLPNESEASRDGCADTCSPSEFLLAAHLQPR